MYLRGIRVTRFALVLFGILGANVWWWDSAHGKDIANNKATPAAGPAWIWQPSTSPVADRVYLRKEFTVKGSASAARLYAVCQDPMSIYLDGEKVLECPAGLTPDFANLTAKFADSTPSGEHVLAVEVQHDKAHHTKNNLPSGVLLNLEFESGWRDAWQVSTDGRWEVTTTPSTKWNRVGDSSDAWQPAVAVAALGAGPWSQITAAVLAAAAPLREPTATPVDQIKAADGFRVELLYSVPKDEQGSWVNLCVDPKGRLIVSDQYGSLYRVTLPAVPKNADSPTPGKVAVEKIPVNIGEAQGLLWAFDSLYVMVNRGAKFDAGLYRVRDTDGDDVLDTLEVLRKLQGRGEHGPHAIMLAPDGESLYVVCGNGTKLPEISAARSDQVWDEDLLLPRCYGRGFMKGNPAPGGFICKIDPDGKQWELIASGFRNEFDAAFNADGELFTYDADMEWDMNTPWYRPTRICHVPSGAEFGWRNGGGKWPVFYPDSLPAVVNIGPGSPTGICFGYGAKFPAKYQQSLFFSDWSYGKLYALHLEPKGSSYTGKFEEFVSASPLPLTDVVINPHDGAMYFAIGGRKVQSGLYRVTYVGKESTEPANLEQTAGAEARALRHRLEALHAGDHPEAVEVAWPYLGHKDRFIRFAARVAIEHRPRSEWQAKALAEKDPVASMNILLGLARQFERENKPTGPELDTLPPVWEEAPGEKLSADRATARDGILQALERTEWSELSLAQQLALLRTYTLTFVRIGPPSEAQRQALIERFDPALPASAQPLNAELLQLLVYLQAPSAAPKGVALLDGAPTQEEQLNLAKTIRHLRAGWTSELQETYFKWFVKGSGFRGGASFTLFVEDIKKDAVANLSEQDRARLKPILEAKPKEGVIPLAVKARPFVKKWGMDELVPLIQNQLKHRDFDRGRQMFAAGNCFACHRFNNEGGAIGPDLTVLSGRFSPRDILESVVEPSKVISDQYTAVNIITIDGKAITGRIVNLAGDSFRINTNMLDPNALAIVDRKQIDEMFPSKVSMMPAGLLDTLGEEEILDLMAYLLSRGDRNHEMFAPKK